jgi:hypothetical protein
MVASREYRMALAGIEAQSSAAAARRFDSVAIQVSVLQES